MLTNPHLWTKNQNRQRRISFPTNLSKLRRPPPIFIQGVLSFAGLVRILEKILATAKFSTVTLPNDVVKVITHDVEDYRLLVRELRKLDVKFYTFQLKAERALKVVIRNIHPSVSPNEIKQALDDLGYNCRSVTNTRHWRSKEPLPLFFIDLEPDEKSKEIYKLETLLHSRIKVESPRPQRTIVQCHRCQQYGHTKTYCRLPAICVKCGEEHTSNCCAKT